MTKKQKIELRLSEVRSRLNEIAGLDELTADIRAEAEKLRNEYRDLEVRHRSAIIADGGDRKQDAPGDRKLIELRSRVSVADYVSAASAGRAVTGAAAEFNAALGMADGRFPLALLDEVETRATTDADGQKSQGTWVDRLFADTAAQHLGVTFASVKPGEVSYPVTTAGATAAQRGRTQDAADAAWTVATTSIEPTRASVRATFSRTDALRLPGLEAALRRDLRAAIAEGIDRSVFVGDSGADENAADVTGLTTATITEKTVTQTQKTDGTATLGVFADLVDGVHAASLQDLRVVAAVGAWRLWEKTALGIDAATSDDRTLAQFMRTAGLRWMARGGIETGTAAGDFAAFVGLGRGIRNAAVAAIWSDAEMVRDMYSGAARSEIALTLHTHWGFALPRAGNFKRVKFVA